MSQGSERAGAELGVVASYYASHVPGLKCSMLFDDGPPRARLHDRFALFTLTSGQALVWCRGEEHLLEPGSLLMLEPGDVQRDLRKTDYSAVLVTLGADLVRAHTQRDAGLRPERAVEQSQSLTAETLELCAAIRCGHELGFRLERLFAALEPHCGSSATRSEPPLVARARRALTEQATGAVSLTELGRRLGCAPSYLCRVFSEHTGLGPHAYQLQQRLLAAARLIESGRTVASAAMLAGFGDESHLRRHFRRRFGVSPGGYQRALAPSSLHKQQPTYVVAAGSIDVGEPVVTISSSPTRAATTPFIA
jgi:AraC-like DNA-binding protein